MDWTAEQETALKAVSAWLRDPKRKQVFSVFGWAGCGKTSIAKELAAHATGEVLFAAYTGKAAHVLRSKGCPNATTIHSLIYVPKTKPRSKLDELEQRLALHLSGKKKLGHDELGMLQGAITEERNKLAQPAFALNETAPAKTASLIIIDECFVRGTRVATPEGFRAVETLRPSDCILNAAGYDTVVRVHKKELIHAQKVVFGNTTVTCSPSHRFFTRRGLVAASDLVPGDELAATETSMRLLRKGVSSGGRDLSLLQQCLRASVVENNSRVPRETTFAGAQSKMRRGPKTILGFWLARSAGADRQNPQIEPDVDAWGSGENKRNTQKDRAQTPRAWWEWPRPNQATRTFALRAWGWLVRRVASYHRFSSDLLQNRPSLSNPFAGNRSRRGLALQPEGTGIRSSQNTVSGFKRVDSSTLLEPRDPWLEQFREADGSLYLYDLTAARHSSFSVEGVLVHNCSMVDARIGNDLLSFGVPVLVLGDPGQLPPIRGAGFFNTPRPDIMLTDIQRQAKENPIIHLATLAREGKRIELGTYGDSKVVSKIDSAEALGADQILVGKNDTRRWYNNRVRQLLGRKELVEVGDKLVCLRNNREHGLLNGGLWWVEAALPVDEKVWTLSLFNDDNQYQHELAWTDNLMGEPDPSVSWFDRVDAQEFTHGQALTVHKSQGSQWDDVLLVDEGHVFRSSEKEWRYTAVTRAAERITIFRR